MPTASEADFVVVAATLRKLCQAALPELALETHLDELPGMDSLRVLHAIALIEEQFEVEVDVAALDRMHRVQDILDAVVAARRMAGVEAGSTS